MFNKGFEKIAMSEKNKERAKKAALAGGAILAVGLGAKKLIRRHNDKTIRHFERSINNPYSTIDELTNLVNPKLV